jgi:transcriptional regulator GlxA family with amidase domain
MRYVKDLRLDRVRETLIQADPAQVSITAVAMNYGFEHLGHFCADYKARFSERPRDTLRRSFS